MFYQCSITAVISLALCGSSRLMQTDAAVAEWEDLYCWVNRGILVLE